MIDWPPTKHIADFRYMCSEAPKYASDNLQLTEALIKAWDSLPQEDLRKLIRSVQWRFHEVIYAGGTCTPMPKRRGWSRLNIKTLKIIEVVRNAIDRIPRYSALQHAHGLRLPARCVRRILPQDYLCRSGSNKFLLEILQDYPDIIVVGSNEVYLKGKVHLDNPRELDELKREMRAIPRPKLEGVMVNFSRRFEQCVENSGHHLNRKGGFPLEPERVVEGDSSDDS
ncbi:hypothetical protein Trydic_g13228 [Trypoxylus dichotomus]